jgi:hypothetical protein
MCRKPASLTIRLGSIAKTLPPETRLAVADAVAYDPPASGETTERLPTGSSPPASANPAAPDVGPSSPREEESGDRVPGGRKATVTSIQGLPRGNSSSSSSAQKESGGGLPGGRSPPGSARSLASQRISWAANNGRASQLGAGEPCSSCRPSCNMITRHSSLARLKYHI